jgi:hypothetical protein
MDPDLCWRFWRVNSATVSPLGATRSCSNSNSGQCAPTTTNPRSRYPVVIDNDFAIWQSLANRYWSAL